MLMVYTQVVYMTYVVMLTADLVTMGFLFFYAWLTFRSGLLRSSFSLVLVGFEV